MSKPANENFDSFQAIQVAAMLEDLGYDVFFFVDKARFVRMCREKVRHGQIEEYLVS